MTCLPVTGVATQMLWHRYFKQECHINQITVIPTNTESIVSRRMPFYCNFHKIWEKPELAEIFFLGLTSVTWRSCWFLAENTFSTDSLVRKANTYQTNVVNTLEAIIMYYWMKLYWTSQVSSTSINISDLQTKSASPKTKFTMSKSSLISGICTIPYSYNRLVNVHMANSYMSAWITNKHFWYYEKMYPKLHFVD